MLRERTQSICATLSSLTVAEWTGVVRNLGANSDGKGVVSIEVADGVEIKTWNNAFSDIMDKTLIEPSSPVFDEALSLSEGDVVRFSGKSISDPENCVREGSMSLAGNLRAPEFIFAFSGLQPVG